MEHTKKDKTSFGIKTINPLPKTWTKLYPYTFVQVYIRLLYTKNLKYKNMYSQDLLRGTLRTIVLKLLIENKKLYGYQITQKVERESQGKIKLTYGALYPILHKMENEGLLKSETMEVDNRLRKYYLLTETGKVASKQKIEEYAAFSKTMQNLILAKSDLK